MAFFCTVQRPSVLVVKRPEVPCCEKGRRPDCCPVRLLAWLRAARLMRKCCLLVLNLVSSTLPCIRDGCQTSLTLSRAPAAAGAARRRVQDGRVCLRGKELAVLGHDWYYNGTRGRAGGRRPRGGGGRGDRLRTAAQVGGRSVVRVLCSAALRAIAGGRLLASSRSEVSGCTGDMEDGRGDGMGGRA